MALPKNKLVVGGVGAIAALAALYLGVDLNWGDAINILLTGDISQLCEQLESANETL